MGREYTWDPGLRLLKISKNRVFVDTHIDNEVLNNSGFIFDRIQAGIQYLRIRSEASVRLAAITDKAKRQSHKNVSGNGAITVVSEETPDGGNFL